MSATTPAATGGPAVPGVDGRSRRWDEHRATRRRELVDATLRAIRSHGAAVGMDDIAAVAGTSKTVFYRHFTDRAGLYAAVAERVDANIMRDVTMAAEGEASGRAVIAAAIDAYLRLVEEEPEIYRFVVTAPILDRPGAGDPSGPVSAHIAEEISGLLDGALRDGGHRGAGGPKGAGAGEASHAAGEAGAGAGEATGVAEAGRSRTWAYGVVGMVRAAADDWLTRGGATSGTSREELAALLTDLAWSGLSQAWS